jgi:hypothetical protein
VPMLHLPLRQLRRVRWAVRGTLVLGVAASVAANVLHARPDPVAQLIAAWPPLALLLTVELISRVPVHRRLLAAARLVATTAIAGIAAWVSYWHMAGVASRYGEQGASPFLLPLSVDGLVIVASVSLVELAGRIRAADATHSTTTVAAVTAARPRTDQPPLAVPAAVPVREPVPAARGAGAGNGIRPATAAGADPRPGAWEPDATRPDAGPGRPARPAPSLGAAAADRTSQVDAEQTRTPNPANSTAPVGDVVPGPPQHARRIPVDAVPDTPPSDGPPADPRAAIAYWHAKDPALKPGDIAAKVGRSRSTVRRILAELTAHADNTAAHAAGGTAHRPLGVNGSATALADSHVSR